MSEKIRRIAIIGAGFAGLSLAWQLRQQQKDPLLKIDLFEDPKHPPASQIATGLLHYFHGIQARLPPLAQEAYDEAMNQLQKLGSFDLYAKPLTLVRPAHNRMQEAIFAKRSRQHPKETEYKELPWNEHIKALWIHNAYLIDSPCYLKTLRLALEKQNVSFFSRAVFPEELEPSYDNVIIATGYASVQIPSLSLNEEHWRLTRGQLGHLSLKEEPMLALNGKTYLIPIFHEKNRWIFGSTFEQISFQTPFEKKEFEAKARENLCQESQKLWPPLLISEETEWHIGYRLAGPNHLPEIRRLGAKTYLFTGLGSKGLLYAAFMAKQLSSHLLDDECNKNIKEHYKPWSYQPS